MTTALTFTGPLLRDLTTHAEVLPGDWARRLTRLAAVEDSVWPLRLGAAAVQATQEMQVGIARDLLELATLRPWVSCPEDTPCPGCAARPQWCWVPRSCYALLEHLWRRDLSYQDAPAWCADLLGCGQVDSAGFVAFLASRTGTASTTWVSWSWVWSAGSANAYLADALSRGLGVQAAASGTAGALAVARQVAGDALEHACVLPDDIALRLRRRCARADAFLRRVPAPISTLRPTRPNRFAWR